MTTDLVAELRDIAIAYPEDVFGPVTDAEVKEHAGLITRNSAAMGRHFSPWFTRAADEIERMRNLLQQARTSIAKAADAYCVCVDGPQRCKYCAPHRALLDRIDAGATS